MISFEVVGWGLVRVIGAGRGTQHLSALRHNLQMAATSREASALEPARRHSNRGGETGWKTQIQMDGEMEGDGDRLTSVRHRDRRGRERERSGVVKKMGWVHLGELWYSINIVLLAFTGHCPLSQHGNESYSIQCTWHSQEKGPEFPFNSINLC